VTVPAGAAGLLYILFQQALGQSIDLQNHEPLDFRWFGAAKEGGPGEKERDTSHSLLSRRHADAGQGARTQFPGFSVAGLPHDA